MNSHEHERLGALAAHRHGVFTRRDAVNLGVSESSIDKRHELGLYQRLAPGVYAIAGTPKSTLQHLAATVASFPALAAASHQTAAEIWGMTFRGFRNLEVVTTRWDRVRRSSVKVHESLDLIPEDVVEYCGIPVTSPARTVVDLGASNKWLVEAALENGIRQNLFTLGEVEAFVARVARRGRRGVGVVRPLLEARQRWDSVTESFLEDEFRKLIGGAGFPPPSLQYVVRDSNGEFVARADFAYPEAMLLIELDSEAHHMDRLSFRRDRSKQNRAILMGWTVLRYTWWDVKENPTRILSDLGQLRGSCGSGPT